MIDVRSVKVATAIIKGHDFFQRLKVTIMKVRTSQADVAQAGRAELAGVIRVAGYLEPAGVLGLRAHADVVKLIVAEQLPA